MLVWDIRAICSKLAAMELDWDAPSLPAATRDVDPRSALHLVIAYGEAAWMAEFQQDSAQSSLDAIETRLQADPRDVEGLHQRAHALLMQRRYDDALADLTRALELQPNPHLLRLRGLVLTHFFSPPRAEGLADLERALALEPDSAQSRAVLAEGLNAMAWNLVKEEATGSGLRQAVAWSRCMVELLPGQQLSLNTLGTSLYRAGDYAEAINLLEQSLSAGRGRLEGFDRVFLAMAHHRLGHSEAAHACLDRARAWAQSHPYLDAVHREEIQRFLTEADRVLVEPAAELPADVFAR